MADAVSKLYAELGFKVNQDGLKQAQALLKDFAKEMSAINNATKEAAKQYGIFSKEQNKQSLNEAKVATEKTKQALNEKRTQILGMKELDRQEDRVAKEKRRRKKEEESEENKRRKEEEKAAKERRREEERAAKEQQKAEEKQAKEAEKAAKERKQRLQGIADSFKTFAVSLRNSFLKISGMSGAVLQKGIQDSLDRSIPTRDFLMTTGVDLSQLQSVMSRMVNTGSAMTQQQIMNDIQKVSQNLKDISLGQGDIVPYKLAGIAAQGDVMGVIRATEEAVKNLDNAMALNLTRRIGLSDDWLASWRFRERFGGDQVQLSKGQQKDIENATLAIRQLIYGFRLLSDQITAVLSPVIENVSELLRDSVQSAARFLKDNSKQITDFLREVSNTIIEYVRSVDYPSIGEKIKNFGNAIGDLYEYIRTGEIRKTMQEFSAVIHKIAGWFGIKIEDEALKAYQPSQVGTYINKTMSPDTQNMINAFSSTPRKYGNVISAVDNHVNNVTINGVFQDELKDEMVNAIEEDKQKSGIYSLQDRVSDISQLWVVGHSVGAGYGG